MKIVYLLNIATKHYTIFAHNLTDEDAETEANKLRKMGYPAMTAPQKSIHSLKECAQCDKQIKQIMKIAHDVVSKPNTENVNLN